MYNAPTYLMPPARDVHAVRPTVGWTEFRWACDARGCGEAFRTLAEAIAHVTRHQVTAVPAGVVAA